MSHIKAGGETTFGSKCWVLPPLILHPFSSRESSEKILDNSKAALMLSGLLPGDESSEEELLRKLLEGRSYEIRMLYFVGKDLMRWMGQCAEFAAGLPELSGRNLAEQSFALLLTAHPPEPVQRKLHAWGVVDSGTIFARAIGLNAVFQEPPGFERLTPEFIRNYHRYTDQFFACYQQSVPFARIGPGNFQFEMYASGEYSRILEAQWETD